MLKRNRGLLIFIVLAIIASQAFNFDTLINKDKIESYISGNKEFVVSDVVINGVTLPEWQEGDLPYYVVNDNVPFFEETSIESFENYSELDELGRCGVAFANIEQAIMPTEKRESIGMIKPSGWHTYRYDDLIPDGKYLYNRCHLIGFQLAGENANPLNLITGTRYLNVEGMLPFENEIDDYVEETNNHVYYRVTPIFINDELVARGVLMEAMSVEDKGKGIMFNVFAYNVQPGIQISYKDGTSSIK